MVIAAAFQKQKSMEDVAALLQNTFHGGNGFKTPEGELSAWYAVDGIHIAPAERGVCAQRAGDHMEGRRRAYFPAYGQRRVCLQCGACRGRAA